MARLTTAKRYAQAAFAIAREEGRIEAWLEDLRRAQEALSDESLRSYLDLAKIGLERKLELLRKVLEGIHPLTFNLIGLLASRGGLGVLPGIVTEYERLLDIHLGRERAEVVTAVPLSEQQQDQAARQLGQLLGKEVTLASRVDDAVIGGIVTRVGDRIIDTSTRGRLAALRRSLVVLPG